MKQIFPINFDAMAEQISVFELLDRAAENVQAQDVQFRREWFYLVASVLAWGLFWEIADRQHENPHAQFLAWVTVFVAVWATDHF